MNTVHLLHRLNLSLPTVVEWIEKTLEENRDRAIPVTDFGFPCLAKVFPHDLLARAKAVVVTGKVRFPPLSLMGLPELGQMESMSVAGITYKDTFFVNHLYQSESLHFHELVHVVQWEWLGVNQFLLAYGTGLIQSGYRDSPLEQMAYALEARFKAGSLPKDLIDLIQRETDAIWANIAPFIPDP